MQKYKVLKLLSQLAQAHTIGLQDVVNSRENEVTPTIF